MKVKTNIKAGGIQMNHNETLVGDKKRSKGLKVMKELAGLLALTFFLILGGGTSIASAQTTYDLWPDKHTLPPFEQIEFLPIFLPGEPIAFVDLGDLTVIHGDKEWKALQFTRDKEFAVTVPVGKYLFGLLGDDWPPNTVDPRQELSQTRLVALEIDGNTIPVNQSDLREFTHGKGSFAIFNVLPRFNTPGTHTLRYILEQKTLFFFVFPYDVIGIPDPFPQFEGRRVFVPETVGDEPLDGKMVLSYNLTVVQ